MLVPLIILGCELHNYYEYCRLRREVKELVREKKITVCNKVVEKVYVDFDRLKEEKKCFLF